MTIDASIAGGLMRFVNHSLKKQGFTNASTIDWGLNDCDRIIGLFATKEIMLGEEILFDYHTLKLKWMEESEKKYNMKREN